MWTLNTIFCAFNLPQRTHTYHEEHLPEEPYNFFNDYVHLRSVTMALLGTGLCAKGPYSMTSFFVLIPFSATTTKCGMHIELKTTL